MLNVQRARAQIEKTTDPVAAGVLRDLLQGLESGGSFELGRLDALSYEDFQLAVSCIRTWRTSRYVCQSTAPDTDA
jgi:hypothetical protein